MTREEKIITEVATNTFDSLRKEAPKKVDFKRIHDFLSYLGKLGEKYVYEKEKDFLKDTKYYDLVDLTPSLNNENGYDILSYEKNGDEVKIEVKTTTDDANDAFYVTNRELETARKAWSQGKKYKFYRVSNIMAEDKDKISLRVYDLLSEKDFEMVGVIYKVKEKT